MFTSLRAKLLVSFISVILLSLFLAGTATLVVLRQYQNQLALNQLSDVSMSLSFQAGILERAGATQGQMAQFLREQAENAKVRILLTDLNGTVVDDTDGTLTGQRIGTDLDPATTQLGRRPTYWGRLRTTNGQNLLLVVSQIPAQSRLTFGLDSSIPEQRIVVVVPSSRLDEALWSMAPSLGFATIASLLVSIGIALLLARSIAVPITEITRASTRMAAGDYSQRIDTRGKDELGRLADAFNRMSQQVSQSHRMLRDFLANVSHELRTPLTSIQGFSQAMVDGALRTPEEYSEAGRIIGEESERMRALVDDLLELSRLESGQIAMDRRPLDVNELLRALHNRWRRLADEHGIELRLESRTPLPSTLGDNHWLEQVFGNLLDNALRHTPGGGSVIISARAVPGASDVTGPADSDGVAISIHNTGSFISPDDLPRIFERFYQADKSRSGGGTGLGLSIVNELVHLHGGAVDVTSEAEAGTTFVVTLPVAKLGADEALSVGSR